MVLNRKRWAKFSLCPSECFFSRFCTRHSISVGSFLEPPPKKMSYSTFRRRRLSSSADNSSSIVTRRLRSREGRLRRGLYHRKELRTGYHGNREGKSFCLVKDTPICRLAKRALLPGRRIFALGRFPGVALVRRWRTGFPFRRQNTTALDCI